MPKPLSNQIVVITGASSGIGRATAVELGRRKAIVVLAARREDALHAAAREVQRSGGIAQTLVTDVSQWEQVENLARKTVERYGRIDTWINNAAVTEYATVEQTTPEEAEQILRVDLLGQIFGSKAALEVMRRQREGTIINVGSVESEFGAPYNAVYSAAKHGIKGFTEGLRRELEIEKSPIQVTLIMPGSVNTPLFEHARSKVGAKPQPLPPAYPPEAVADAIAFACENPRREIVVGGAGKAFTLMERVSPGLLDWFLGTSSTGQQQQISDQSDDAADNLFGPAPEESYRTHGSFGDLTLSSSLYTRLLELNPAARGLLLAAGGLGALWLLKRLTRGQPH